MVIELHTDCGIWYIEDVSDFVDLVMNSTCDAVTLTMIAEELENRLQYPFIKVLNEILEKKHEDDD